MDNLPEDLVFTKTHEWVRKNADGTVTVGITHHAQELLGDMVFVEVPEVGGGFHAGDDCAVVESVKAASDVYCPLDGEITDANDELADTPEVVNQDPYGKGWLFQLKPEDEGAIDELLTAEAYLELVESEDH
jgi:glycine cleavage system H protein